MDAKRYVNLLRDLNSKTGPAKRKLKSFASDVRQRLIARNGHAEDSLPAPKFAADAVKNAPREYQELLAKAMKTKDGKKALKKYQQFWRLKYPTEIKVMNLPGPKNKTVVLVGMGRSPNMLLADGPKGSSQKKKKVKGRYTVATDPNGRRIMLLSGVNTSESKQVLRDVGFAPETHYIPTSRMEKAGTPKKGKYWVHKHDDDGGRWPRVKQDQAGNFIYDPGTYRVKAWIYR